MKRSKLLVLLFMSFIVSVKAQTTEEGIKAIDYENYATARRIFSQLTKSQPSNSINYYYLGIVYCTLDKIDSARMAFNAGIQADPKSIHNYVGLGRAYLEQNNVQQATQNFDKAKSMTSQKDITQYKLIADAYSSAAHPNYDMAVALLNKAIGYTNKDAEVYWILGKAYEAMNKSGDAVSSYERSTELNPSYAKAYTRIGVIWRNARNGNLAKENFDKALQADPNFPPAHRELAELYFYTGKYDLADQTYEKYLQLADQDDETLFRKAQFKFLTKKYSDALSLLNSLKAKIRTPYMFRMLGYANYETAHYPEGLKNMDSLFRTMDSSKIITSDYEYLGKLQIKSGNDSLGFLSIEKAIHFDSTKYELFDTIGTYLYKQKKYAQAGIYYMKKLKALPKNAPFNEVANSYKQAGLSLYLGKKYWASDSVFEKVSRITSQWAVPYLFRARIQLNIDSLDTVRGKAFPFYNLFISKAYGDTLHYRRELTEAYQYLGNYNTHYKNYGVALYYFNKVVALNDTNKEVIETINSIKNIYKTAPGSSITATKDTTGFLIPAIINGHSVNALYDPGIFGIGVTQEGLTQIAGGGSDGEAGKGAMVKIGDHSLKNVMITAYPDEKQPVAIGADVLNKMNMVFDYPSSSVLQR